MIKQIKKLWAGRAWVHGKYLNKCSQEKTYLKLKYQGDTMTIPYDSFKQVFDRKKTVRDKFNPDIIHNQYGVIWIPDDNSVKPLFT